MLLLFTTIYIFQQTLAMPLPAQATLEDPSVSTCTRRSVWNIIWSCLVTIFACTWVSVHPNVPMPEHNAQRRWYSRPLRRAYIMLYALIGPEFVVFWAWRERVAASRISATLPDWSRMHGFFALMGGFVDGTEILSRRRIEELVERNEIEYPIVSREEIQDRSKGDTITKALVVLQTTWFLLQCAVRASNRLAVTELELATAAFAVLNIVVYVLWWDKPLDVQCHIKVQRRRGAQVQGGAKNPTHSKSRSRSCCRAWTWENIVDSILDVVRPFFVMMRAKSVDGVFSVVQKDTVSGDNENVLLWLLGTLVSVVFGGIHCIGWSFDFPSHTERILWRLSSAAITGIPLAYVGILIGGRVPAVFRGRSWFSIFFLDCTSYITPILYLLYVISRVLLLVLLVSTLRSLPPSAFQTVKWTTFLPHV